MKYFMQTEEGSLEENTIERRDGIHAPRRREQGTHPIINPVD